MPTRLFPYFTPPYSPEPIHLVHGAPQSVSTATLGFPPNDTSPHRPSHCHFFSSRIRALKRFLHILMAFLLPKRIPNLWCSCQLGDITWDDRGLQGETSFFFPPSGELINNTEWKRSGNIRKRPMAKCRWKLPETLEFAGLNLKVQGTCSCQVRKSLEWGCTGRAISMLRGFKKLQKSCNKVRPPKHLTHYVKVKAKLSMH